MAEVAKAFVSLMPSARGFGAATEKQVGGELQKSGGKIGAGFGKAIKVGATAAVGAGLVAAGFLKGAVSASSDLAESQSKVGVVFGRSADQIVRASRGSAAAMGLSQNAYLAATGTLGNLLVSLEIAPKKAAKMSQQMVKLAGDLASFNNVSPEEALDALKAGLTGEAEPLKKFGVNMNDATLKAEALKLGLIKTTKDALNPQTKALAAQSLIMSQTKTAQGDFARTSGGLANQQRILAAQFENVQATIGKAFLPVATKAVALLNEKVVPAVSDFITGMQDGTGAGGEFVGMLKDAGAVAKGVVNFIDDIPGPVKQFGIAAGVTALVLPRLAAGATMATGAIARMNTALTTTAGRQKVAAAGVAQLGSAARVAAGAGGMLLLAKNAGTANTATGALGTTAGAAALGFSLGGPWGAAIGAVGGLGFSLWKAVDAGAGARTGYEKLKVAVGQLAQTSSSYKGTLDIETAAVTRQTRELILNRLQKSGLLDATRKLGISDQQAVLAISGNTQARNRLSAALVNTGRLTNQQRQALINEGVAVDRNREQVLKNNVAVAGNARELRIAKERLHAFQQQANNNSIKIKVDTAEAVQRVTGFVNHWNTMIGKMKQPPTAGPGGVDVLLNLEPRAHGGPVKAGKTYLVGERGPELFTAQQSGRITPNHELSGGAGGDGGPTIKQYFPATSSPEAAAAAAGGRVLDALAAVGV